MKDYYQKTILGYYNKDHNKFGILKEPLPVLTQNTYSSFLITDKYHFTVSDKSIVQTIKNHKKLLDINDVKVKTAGVLIIPGLLISASYALKIVGAFYQSTFIEELLSSKLVNLTFWISVLGIIILWHDNFRIKGSSANLPATKMISPNVIKDAEINGFRFGRYTTLDTASFTSETVLGMLADSMTKDSFSCYKLFTLLLKDPVVQEILNKGEVFIDQEVMDKYLINEMNLPSYPIPAVRSLLIYALKEAIITESKQVYPIHLFLCYINLFPVLKKFFTAIKFPPDLLRTIAAYQYSLEKGSSRNIFNPKNTYYRSGGILKTLLFSSKTQVVQNCSQNINELVSQERRTYGIGHEDIIERISKISAKSNFNNILILGDSGSGKSSIIKALAQRINENKVPSTLMGKRVIRINYKELKRRLHRTKNSAQLIKDSIKELFKPENTIIFIDNFEEFFSEAQNKIDDTVVEAFLTSGLTFITTINLKNYQEIFYNIPGLSQMFNILEIQPLSDEETLQILLNDLDTIQRKYNISITIPALLSIIELASKPQEPIKQPLNSILKTQEICKIAKKKSIKVLTTDIVKQISGVNTENDLNKSTHKLLSEKLLNLKIVGQNEAVNSVIYFLNRNRTTPENRPLGLFLFYGPSGVGKTHLAKVISQDFFTIPADLLVFEASELKAQNDIIQNIHNPFIPKVILVNGIERDKNDHTLKFIDRLVKGQIHTAEGNPLNLKNIVLIATTEVGNDILKEAYEKDNALWEETKNRVLLDIRNSFKPDFFEHFDSIVPFKPLTIENYAIVANRVLQDVAASLVDKSIRIEWRENLPYVIADRYMISGSENITIKQFIHHTILPHISEYVKTPEFKSNEQILIRESWLTENI